MIYANTKEFRIDNNGKVIGVKLKVENVPSQQYIVTHLRLVDEYESNGKTEAVCGSNGRRDFYLCWPYSEGKTSFENMALPGNNNGIHIITNGYNPTGYGYLAIAIGKPIISQVVGGLGLPNNHHVSYEINFGRLIDPIDPIDPDLPDNELLKRVDRIERFLLSYPTFKDFS